MTTSGDTEVIHAKMSLAELAIFEKKQLAPHSRAARLRRRPIVAPGRRLKNTLLLPEKYPPRSICLPAADRYDRN